MKSYILPFGLLFFGCNSQNTDDGNGQSADTNQIEVAQGGMDSYLPSEEGIGYSESNNTYCDVKFGAYLYDPGEEHTNIRSAPNGNVIMTLNWDAEEEYMVSIVASEGEWFKIESPILGIERDYLIEAEYAWVHNSVLAIDTRNYANQTIEVYQDPNVNSKILSKIEHESGGLRPLKACGDWVYIQVTLENVSHKGWINIDWICGHPLTTCA
ncbi:hypothetical protein N8987_05385 [Crocinitomix sp.]|nr:hypothetical protein [Crocinitomix sp.]